MKTQLPSLYRTSCFALALLSTSLAPALLADDAPTKLVAGSKLDRLTVGAATYQNVLVRSVTARTAMITFDGGMKSILLCELTPELQQRFGYNAEAERAAEATAKAGQAAVEKRESARIEALKKSVRARQNASRVDELLKKFGQPAPVYSEVNFRSRFEELGLEIKSQGKRSSCAIFSIVSALEFQSAEDRGGSEKFSEEYLLWATRKVLGRIPAKSQSSDDQTPNETSSAEERHRYDAGFTLPDVVTGINSYGIIASSRMPNRFAGNSDEPSEEIISDARYTRKVIIQTLPGDSGAALVQSVIHALNAGLPVPVGMALPIEMLQGQSHLHSQGLIQFRHAVTIVGYKSSTRKLEDTVFTFRNSWGTRWGEKGYGTITYQALVTNIMAAIVLELQ